MKTQKVQLCILLLSIFNFLTLNSFCQEEYVKTETTQTFYKFAPTSLLNPLYPAIHLAVEYKYPSKISNQIELGYILPRHLLNKSETTFGSYNSLNKGFFIKLEHGKYSKKVENFYLAIQLQYIYNHYKRTDTFDSTPMSTGPNLFCSTCVEDTYFITKNLAGISFKLGYQITFNKFVFDTYFGLGLNYIHNVHNKNTELHKYPAVADSPISYYASHYPGSYPTLAFNLGLKIGYDFEK